MKRVLITGMSGTGKSAVIEALAARAIRRSTEGGYSHLVNAQAGEVTGVGGGQDWNGA